MKPDAEVVGHRIKELRLNKGLTLEEFGKLFKTSKVTVYNWETGRNLPNKSNISAIADLGNISVNELLYGTPKEYISNTLWGESGFNLDSNTLDKFYDELVKRTHNTDDLYMDKTTLVTSYINFANHVERDKNIDELGRNIQIAMKNKDNAFLVEQYLMYADQNYTSLFGQDTEFAYNYLESKDKKNK